jgi:hypothetical protein
VVPLREELKSTDIRLGCVTGGDPAARRLEYVTPDGRDESLEYDQLIVALGSVSRVLPVPGLAEHGIGFKTISEAIALRNRALVNLEIAETLGSPEERRPWLSWLSPGWHELAAGRSGRADHARDPSRVGRVRRAGATWARDRHPNLDDTQRRYRLGGDALDG